MNLPVAFNVSNGQDITLQQGDDYLAADGRGVTWTTAAVDEWPTLSGATVSIQISRSVPMKSPGGIAGKTVAGTIAQATGPNKSVSVDLAAALTKMFAVGPCVYQIQARATLADSSTITLFECNLNINGSL